MMEVKQSSSSGDGGSKAGGGGKTRREAGDGVDCQHLPDATSLWEERDVSGITYSWGKEANTRELYSKEHKKKSSYRFIKILFNQE